MVEGPGAKTASRIVRTTAFLEGSRRRTRLSVEDYLELQGRFCHLLEPTRQDEAIRHIQERVHAYWNQFNA